MKTRLAVHIGEKNAADMYRCMVEDTLSAAKKSSSTIALFCSPEHSITEYETWLGRGTYAYYVQDGNDLGAKMKNAFKKLFTSFEHVVLIGSDIPEIRHTTLTKAFQALHENKAVLGPSADGGYYLIGFSQSVFCEDIFDDMPWSTNTVFDAAITVLQKNKIPFTQMEILQDIDEFSDIHTCMKNPKNHTLKTAVKTKEISSVSL